MIRLVAVELQRLRSRRILVLAMLASTLIAGIALFTVDQQAARIQRAMSGADEMLQQQIDYWEENGERDRADCEQQQEAERRASGDGSIDFACDQMGPPTAEQMYGSMPSLAGQYDELLLVMAFPLLLLALAVGSTLVAAEFTHRTMGSWLTFVPRRGMVFTSKVLAAALAALPIVAIGLALVLLGVPAIFRWRGVDGGGTQAEWVALAWTCVRILGLATAAGVFGAAAGFLVRHSAVVVGVMLGYLVAVEGIVGGLLPWLSRYLIGRNVSAVVEYGTSWTTYTNCEQMNGCRELIQTLSFTQASITLTVIVLLVTALGLVRFLRSDID
ncbi:MAG: hypothetical protein DI571_04020 [Arsenicicoccus sp.]|uniref:ABC transporter permease subunit n=1 Tax=Serinicoccus profundi TaxID=1078471 RepID=UPI000255E266|nr:ABC transporter permease subunit [Serinicoccus profundi]PZU47803.1 MAG: hypothetical protein DI571_04020 [Arsenicicoccus sp.]